MISDFYRLVLLIVISVFIGKLSTSCSGVGKVEVVLAVGGAEKGTFI